MKQRMSKGRLVESPEITCSHGTEIHSGIDSV
jgi:hypothetical protein